MAEPYKRKTRFSGLEEHERLQKQKGAWESSAAERAKKRLKRMKPKLSRGAQLYEDLKRMTPAERAKKAAEEWKKLSDEEKAIAKKRK